MPDQLDVGQVIEGQQAGRFQRALMLWLVLTMLIEGNDNQVAGYAAPAMIQALHIDRARFGAVFGVTLLGYMLGALVLGAAADRPGRRRIVIAGALGFGVFTLATAYVTTLPDILALRFLAGIGLGAAVPSLVALMAEYAPTASRGAAHRPDVRCLHDRRRARRPDRRLADPALRMDQRLSGGRLERHFPRRPVVAHAAGVGAFPAGDNRSRHLAKAGSGAHPAPARPGAADRRRDAADLE